ncbi:MAG: hypothetical protein C4555_03155 [Dehalococcoidia bacterium]|nr:MAG: hypothetical protein C4555_03155 [Dehalococcoidia bacterium]
MDELLNGGQLVRIEAERRARETAEKKELDRKEKLIAQSRVFRMLTSDDVIQAIREKALFLKADALLKVIDASKRQPGETLETLAVEARCHDMYCKMFDKMEIEGKKAIQTLQEESKPRR